MPPDWVTTHLDVKKGLKDSPFPATVQQDIQERTLAKQLDELIGQVNQLIPPEPQPYYPGSHVWNQSKQHQSNLLPHFNERLRQKLTSNLDPNVQSDAMFTVKEPLVDVVSAVTKLLPLYLTQYDLDEDQAIAKLRPLLRICFIDQRIFEMHAHVYEVYRNLKSAYEWAYHGYAILRSAALLRKVDTFSEELVASEMNSVSGEALFRALTGYSDPSSSAPLLEVEPMPPFRYISKKDIPPGSDVLYDRPWVCVPCVLATDDRDQGCWCTHCGSGRNFAQPVIPCCVMPKTCPFTFCSPNCFIEHSRCHQYSCQFLHTQLLPLAHHSGFTAAFILLIARLLIKSFVVRIIDKQPHPAEDDAVFHISKEFTSVYFDYRCYRPELWSACQTLSRAMYHFFPICEKLGLASQDMDDFISRVHSHCFIIESFSHNLRSTSLLCLSPLISKLQHSCVPNTFVSYDVERYMTDASSSKTLILRSVAFIKAGEPLAFSFQSDLYKPNNLRKGILQCLCERCRDPSEGLRFVAGLRCPECLLGYACPRRLPRVDVCITRRPPDQLEVGHCGAVLRWECSRCGLLPSSMNPHFDELLSGWQERLDRVRETANESTISAREELAELREEMITHAHPNHHLRYDVEILLVGLWKTEPKKNDQIALKSQLHAMLSAFRVLPFADIQHVLLGISLVSLLPPTVLRPDHLYRALWSSYCCLGPSHPLTLNVITTLTTISGATRHAVKPRRSVSCGSKELLRTLHLSLWPSMGTPSDDDLEFRLRVNPSYLWFPAIRSGQLPTIRYHMEVEGMPTPAKRPGGSEGDSSSPPDIWLDAIDSSTGLPSLGVAISNKQVRVFEYLANRSSTKTLLYKTPWFTNYAHIIAAAKPLSGFDGATLKEWDRAGVMMLRAWLLALNDSPGTEGVTQQVLTAPCHKILGSQTPIHYAAHRGKVNLLRELIDLNRIDNENSIVVSPIDEDTSRQRAAGNVDVQNGEAATPLHMAALAGHTEVCRSLIEYGANVNIPTYRGETALMLACHALAVDCVRYLVEEANADIWSTSPASGITCLHALVVGVTKTYRVAYQKTRWSREGGSGIANAAILLTGFNAYSLHEIYEIELTDCTAPSLPQVSNESTDLIKFPDELLKRVSHASEIVSYLRSRIHARNYGNQEYNEAIFSQSCDDGFTPSELLLHQWQQITSLYDEAVHMRSNAVEDKENYRRQFVHELSTKVYQLATLLKPMLQDEPSTLDLASLTRDGIRCGTPVREKSAAEEAEKAADLATVLKRKQYKAPQLMFRTMADELDEAKEAIQKEIVAKTAAP